jgi:pilus assembly protein CpaE
MDRSGNRGFMIRVLIVDDAPLTRANVERLLGSEPDMESVGAVGDSNSALSVTERLRPDVVLVDMDLSGVDGLRTSERLSRTFPGTMVILMGLDDDEVTRSMAREAGAVDYLVKPFGGDELLSAIRRVSLEVAARSTSGTPARVAAAAAPPPLVSTTPTAGRQVIAVVAAKGGSGTTVLATNLALLIASEANRRVALVDLDIEHGHVQRLLRLESRSGILDALRGGPAALGGALTVGPANLSVLTAPSYANAGADPAALQAILGAMREMFDVVIIDVPNRLTAVEAAAIDAADRVILLSQMSDLGVRATVGLRRTLEGAGIASERILTVLNRIEANSDLTKANVEEALRTAVSVQLPYDPILVSTSMNRGAPFVLQRPDAQVSRKLRELAGMLVPMPSLAADSSDVPPVALPANAEDDGGRKKQRKGLFGFART